MRPMLLAAAGVTAAAVLLAAACSPTIEFGGNGGAGGGPVTTHATTTGFGASGPGSTGTTTGTTTGIGSSVTTTGPTTTTVTTGPGTTVTTGTTMGTTTSTTTAVTTTGTGGPQNPCIDSCAAQHPQAWHRFELYELKECGCQPSAPCVGACGMTACASQMIGQNSPCDVCLGAEIDKGTGSPCTVKAAINDCQPDQMCSPFLSCALQCP